MPTIELRTYQQRVIDQLVNYLDNNSIHIVAPPGSGKTILGITIIDKIQRKTLILVPSLLLKKQWIDTIQEYYPQWEISENLLQPAQITITTYQDLLGKGKEWKHYFEEYGINFLVLDESHHLKKRWSDLLLHLREHANDLQTLALTATPPFDANQKEWKNYIRLTGAIDEEISVSELIKEEVLAPYHDYIYLVPVTKEAQGQFSDFLENQNQIVAKLCCNQEVTDYLLAQEFIQQPLNCTTFIYKNFDVYLSCLFYLNEQHYQIGRDHWKVLGTKRKKFEIPQQTRNSIIDLYQYLYHANPRLNIFNYLSKAGWLYNDKLRLFPNFEGTNQANIPLVKEAIQHIVIKEESYLGSMLRGVLLFDHIKKDVLDGKENYLEYGVAPAFLDFKDLLKPETSLAAICGEFLIISQEVYQNYFINYSAFQKEKNLANYVYLTMTDKNQSSLLSLTTQLLDSGILNLLIGTVSLLGEGWNCPSINTIIMGNAAGSYVQTQQIRGRGLRKDGKRKLTNIWHIGVIYPNIPLAEQPSFASIFKRLSFIEGLNLLTVPLVSTGSERFELPDIPDIQAISGYTQHNLFQAKEREKYFALWSDALKQGTRLAMPLFIRNQSAEKELDVKTTTFKNRKEKSLNFFQSLLQGNLAFYFKEQKKRRLWRNSCRIQQKVVQTIYQLLINEGLLSEKIPLTIKWDETVFSCEVTASYHQEKLFNNLVSETLGEIENPRYLLKIKHAYFAVPARYSKNKKDAQSFLAEIQKSYSSAEIFYSKNLAGRKHLINARLNTLINPDNLEIIEQKIWH
ncbi:DEAD/DEAH box helicase family protein [Enterococcus sp. MJM16]|uniref:DEAD/DEAH box helicase family protein n=1 Tax=Candidatus Enterococcus murrayae TaxID=2815321 RepID=A0ABS3HLW7_9ENTE|nr:DEAD/DEAH box helicase family protein [Enterococcus sp. MJM16]